MIAEEEELIKYILSFSPVFFAWRLSYFLSGYICNELLKAANLVYIILRVAHVGLRVLRYPSCYKKVRP